MSRERILVGGAPGTGKTYGWLTIARMLPQVTFHVLDPDDGVRRVKDADFPDVKNLNYYLTPTWFGEPKVDDSVTVCGISNALTTIRKVVKPNDWIILEMLSSFWSLAQGGFVEEVFNEGIGEYFLQARKELRTNAKRLEALRGWTDWSVINKMHNDDFMNVVCYRLPAHVYMTTSVSIASQAGEEDAEVRAFYGDSKIRFEGQKYTPWRAQSVLLFHKDRAGWKYSTFLKDRGRTFVDAEPLYSFAEQYLVGVAGW